MSTTPLVDAFYAELHNGRRRQAVTILTSAVEHAITSISRGRPGYAHYQLERARLRAQRVLDGTVPADEGGEVWTPAPFCPGHNAVRTLVYRVPCTQCGGYLAPEAVAR